MRGLARSRYEGALSQIARGARAAATVLSDEGDDEAAWEYRQLAAWTHREFEASAREKKPLKGKKSLFPRPEVDGD